jgi:conjugal transfer mating pair stabilization protein TraN
MGRDLDGEVFHKMIYILNIILNSFLNVIAKSTPRTIEYRCVDIEVKRRRILAVTLSMVFIFLIASSTLVNANLRFQSSYSCSDKERYCMSEGIKTIDGEEVHRDCWEYAYKKTCNYPSQNNCRNYSNCYNLGQRDCLLKDSLGNCVNIKKEFSCMSYEATHIASEKIRYGLEDKEGREGLVCKGIPCIDGNCVDKSYEMDGDMVSSVSQLGAMAQGKSDGVNIKIFEGTPYHCSDKMIGACSCCGVFPKGWGRSLGMGCTKDEKTLSKLRADDLCVFASRTKTKKMGFTTVTKEHYCCWGNILEKTIQVEGRKQLGMSFANGSSPNCRGLNADEIGRVDFSKMDFSKVAADMHKKIALPDHDDIKSRITDALDNSHEYDPDRPAHKSNYMSGVNKRLITDEKNRIKAEKEEKEKLERERLERERLERERKERERLEKIRLEKERLERIRLEKIRIEKERLERERLEKIRLEKIIVERKKEKAFKDCWKIQKEDYDHGSKIQELKKLMVTKQHLHEEYVVLSRRGDILREEGYKLARKALHAPGDLYDVFLREGWEWTDEVQKKAKLTYSDYQRRY